jgi:hypothetical protein
MCGRIQEIEQMEWTLPDPSPFVDIPACFVREHFVEVILLEVT